MFNKKLNIIGIGELLWDELPAGKILGGAPANFVFHANYLGADACVISAVGNDDNGLKILNELKEKGISYSVNKVKQPTGTVQVELKDGIPTYKIQDEVAWDYIVLQKQIYPKLKQVDAICFGSLSQRNEISKNEIYKALHLVPKNALKIFDVNLRLQFYSKEIIEHSLNLANVFKLNDEELDILSKMFHLTGNEIDKCKQIISKFELNYLALTKGSEGSVLIHKNNISQLAVPKIKVIDTVGAGDSFTAALTVGILKNYPLKTIHKKAVSHAALVCSYEGATSLK
ncbi:MAG: carbohydrate kinase family protein [Lutibacter sp.]